MKKFVSILLFVIGYGTLFLSCSKDNSDKAYPVDEDIILTDVSYGSHPQQKIDVYLPEGRSSSSTKFVVFIHGGGWAGGDKSDLPITQEALDELKKLFPGFALFNVNYRLVDGADNRYPAAEQDIKSALDFIYAHLKDYQISSDTYMVGGSAGAHLAALHTLKNNIGNRIKGCIGISGAYNMVSLYNDGSDEVKLYVSAFLGGTPTEKTAVYEQASPIRFVSASSPKFLILHGKDDDLTPIGQANEFIQKLQQHGVEHTVFTYSGGHGIPGEHIEKAFEHIVAFLL